MALSWTGIYAAVTTPFDASGEVHRDLFQQQVHHMVTAGVDAIIVGGSLGESSTITHDERIDLLALARRAGNHPMPVLVNIAEGSTKNAVALAQRAEQSGAAGLMVLPPMMYKASDAEVVHFFSDIATETSLPLMIYNNPVDYKIEVTPAMFDSLLKLDNIQAVKESTRDISNITRLQNHFGDRLKILTGVDTIALESLVMGAQGWVAGLVNAFPEETVAIYKLVVAGRIREAIEIYRWFMPVLELDINAQLVQNIKLAASMTGIGSEYVRSPRQPLRGEERERVAALIRKAIATRPYLPD
jgi:4-hydroxy-tetrahydrodipicolinate synthase